MQPFTTVKYPTPEWEWVMQQNGIINGATMGFNSSGKMIQSTEWACKGSIRKSKRKNIKNYGKAFNGDPDKGNGIRERGMDCNHEKCNGEHCMEKQCYHEAWNTWNKNGNRETRETEQSLIINIETKAMKGE